MEACLTVKSGLTKVKFVLPAIVAGVAEFEEKVATCPDTSLVEVATFPEPLPPVAVMVMGEDPITVKAVQEALPEQEALVVATVCTAFVPAPYKSLLEVNDVAPVPPCCTLKVVTANAVPPTMRNIPNNM